MKKTVIRVRTKQCNVSSCMNYLEFAFKGPKYARNLVFFVDILAEFLKYLKSRMVVFLTLNICRKLRILEISSSQWNMSLVSIFWVIWRKIMHTCKAPDLWGLHKNMNCAFPLKKLKSFEVILNSFEFSRVWEISLCK